MALDVADEASVRTTVTGTVAEYGRLDVLVKRALQRAQSAMYSRKAQ